MILISQYIYIYNDINISIYQYIYNDDINISIYQYINTSLYYIHMGFFVNGFLSVPDARRFTAPTCALSPAWKLSALSRISQDALG